MVYLSTNIGLNKKTNNTTDFLAIYLDINVVSSNNEELYVQEFNTEIILLKYLRYTCPNFTQINTIMHQTEKISKNLALRNKRELQGHTNAPQTIPNTLTPIILKISRIIREKKD